MTDNEIIKTLDCCAYGNCSDCPIHKNCDDYTMGDMYKLSIELINRQKAEIERLEQMLDCSVSSERNAVDDIPYKCAEEIKVFAEKVDYLIGTTPSVPNRTYRKLSAGIKNLVKELVGDDNA